ncbi:hypothetical protein BJY52DRAFT_1286614 [Lactarius psammicola]|nr:hypothetical protein BJY52DRAFT_1286614 [Lactarius psammicola]
MPSPEIGSAPDTLAIPSGPKMCRRSTFGGEVDNPYSKRGRYRTIPRGGLVTRERALLPRTFVTPKQAANTVASTITPKKRATTFSTRQFSRRFPTSIQVWDKDTFSGGIRAMRPISEGEELTISYFQEVLEPGAVTHERQNSSLKGTASNARV